MVLPCELREQLGRPYALNAQIFDLAAFCRIMLLVPIYKVNGWRVLMLGTPKSLIWLHFVVLFYRFSKRGLRFSIKAFMPSF